MEIVCRHFNVNSCTQMQSRVLFPGFVVIYSFPRVFVDVSIKITLNGKGSKMHLTY